jgi:hypothetical protein
VIANLRGICRAGAIALAGFAILARAQPETRPDLVGRIVPPHGGSARATVIVFGASPKNGGAISLAYPDCGKRAQSDDQGDFKIESLDPQLKFRFLIAGPGCQPQVIDGLVPADGAFTARLEAADASLTTTNSARGRVVDAKGAAAAIRRPPGRPKLTIWHTAPGSRHRRHRCAGPVHPFLQRPLFGPPRGKGD